jgi:hypothetical protein
VTTRGLAVLAALVVVAVAVAFVLGPRPAPPAAAPHPGMSSEGRPAPAVHPPAPVDPAAIRDIFRFADRPAPATVPETARAAAAAPGPPTPSASGPRLVGLVRRDGRLLAALAVDGNVILAGPGETVAGVTVLAVGEEGVRLRRPDGSEETLALP